MDVSVLEEFYWASELWRQSELPAELESDQRDIVDWSAGKSELVILDFLNNSSAILMWMHRSVCDAKPSCWDHPFLLNWIRDLTLLLLLKCPLIELEPWFVLWSFFLQSLSFISVDLSSGLVWILLSFLGCCS